jgi:hypothetical protein
MLQLKKAKAWARIDGLPQGWSLRNRRTNIDARELELDQ